MINFAKTRNKIMWYEFAEVNSCELLKLYSNIFKKKKKRKKKEKKKKRSDNGMNLNRILYLHAIAE